MENQKEEIIKSMNRVIEYSQEVSNIDSANLFDRLLTAKEFFIKSFGGLIYEIPEPISFEISQLDKEKKVAAFCEEIEDKYEAYELSKFIYSQIKNFFNNRIEKPYIINSKTIIPSGMKILKAFKYFEEDETVLRILQDKASEIIQEDKITGKLCFSVHPLDFLSSSENSFHWRSCHSLDGEYRAGNLSYMVDNCTFMCYLKAEGNQIINNFPSDVPWNSKKWRVLMFLNDNRDMMFAGRQYPFFSETGIDIVKEQIEKLFSWGKWTDWQKDKIRSYKADFENMQLGSAYVGVGTKLIPMKTLVKDGSTNPLHFNDLLKSSCYDPMYCYKHEQIYSWYTPSGTRDSVVTLNTGRFVIGGDVKCLRCNSNFISLSETMLCTDCELKYGHTESDTFAICPYCGSRFLYDDGTWVDSAQETVCPHCADDYVVTCAHCGRTAYVSDNEIIYNRNDEEYYCYDCP